MSAARQAALSTLGETIELQRVGCELAGSDLYARVLAVVASDVDGGGPCADLLGPYASAPVGDAVMLRLLAGVHALVLEGRAPDLAVHYPSAGGGPGRGHDTQLAEAFVRTVGEHLDHLAGAMRRRVQTNEVGRSAALLCGFLEVAGSGLPLRVLEVGASAGLNLHFDRYRYVSGDWSFGPADSPVRFDDPYQRRPPVGPSTVEVVERRGCDLDPIDASSPGGALRLRSFVWPDQADRLSRLDDALQVAASFPVQVDRAGAVGWLGAALAEPAIGTATVVCHSIVFQYLSPTDRERFMSVLDGAGSRATERSPLVWLRMEPGGDQAEVRLTSWPGGHTRLVARSSYHGPPVTTLSTR